MTAVIIRSMWEIAEYAIDRVIADEPDWACFEASHAILPRRVRITIATAASSANSILREAKILESLRHPGVPRVYECGYLDDQLPWVATELVAGPSVDGSLAVRALAELLRDVGAILAFAHARGVIHGDHLARRDRARRDRTARRVAARSRRHSARSGRRHLRARGHRIRGDAGQAAAPARRADRRHAGDRSGRAPDRQRDRRARCQRGRRAGRRRDRRDRSVAAAAAVDRRPIPGANDSSESRG